MGFVFLLATAVTANFIALFLFKKIVMDKSASLPDKQQVYQSSEDNDSVDDYIGFTNKIFGFFIIPGVALGSWFLYFVADELSGSGSDLVSLPGWLKFIPLIMGFLILLQVISRMYFEKTRVTSLWHAKAHGKTRWVYLIYVYGILPAIYYKKNYIGES